MAAILRIHWRWALMASWFALLPTKNLWNAPVLAMALAGTVMLARSWHSPGAPRALRWMALAFALIWVPMIASLAGAADFDHALLTTGKFLRFPLAGVFMVTVVACADDRRRLGFALFAIVLFWCADVLWQFAFGRDFFGYPWRNHRLPGLFYPKLHMVLIIAAFLPIFLEAVRRLAVRSVWYWALCLPVVVVLVLGGARNAWIMAALSGALYAGYFVLRGTVKPRWGRVAIVVLSGLVVIVSMYRTVPIFERRVDETLGLFSAEFEVMDAATGQRLGLWRVATSMIEQNWLTGLGPRGFRHAFTEHADPESFWMRRDFPGATHPHQFVLEVGAETGLIGLLGYTLVLGLMVATFARAGPQARDRMLPWTVSALTAWFPLSSHMAFYGSFWSTLAWWLLCAHFGAAEDDSD